MYVIFIKVTANLNATKADRFTLSCKEFFMQHYANFDEIYMLYANCFILLHMVTSSYMFACMLQLGLR